MSISQTKKKSTKGPTAVFAIAKHISFLSTKYVFDYKMMTNRRLKSSKLFITFNIWLHPENTFSLELTTECYQKPIA
ncbi:hypothetical protein TNIN_107591 [Trichonephila inaurata madagascariensis]|uniref:Uncharacterized protein n=1 Tax=Trichonephila inaurata madagascariensis TaxID=2747483 RepID=A0A8X6WRK5_9ARAC|nr:hypothetical protein TNIN_107591 [Trichonephila inaurata madagascariensis]